MANNRQPGPHQLSVSFVDKMNSLVRLVKNIRQISDIRNNHRSISQPTVGSLLSDKYKELSQLSFSNILQEDGAFPTLHSHFSVFQDALCRCVQSVASDHEVPAAGFDELMFCSGVVQGHVELLLELNRTYWRTNSEQCIGQVISLPLSSPSQLGLASVSDLLVSSNAQSNPFAHPPSLTLISSQPPVSLQPSFQSFSNTTANRLFQSVSLDVRPLQTVSPVATEGASLTQGDLPLISGMSTTLSQCKYRQHYLVDEKTVHVDLKDHAHNQVISLWRDQKHTDVTFLVGAERKRVDAHRTILACQSCYFQSLLFGEMLEAGSDEIALLDISQPRLFVSLVEYVYTGELHILKQDVLDVLALADRFGFTTLKDYLGHNLASMVTLDNVLTFLAYADLYQVKHLLDTCLCLIDKKAEDVLNCDDLSTLTSSCLQLIISRDTFLVPEIRIYEAVLRWREHNSLNKEDCEHALGCVRLSEIPAKELFTTIEPAKIFDQSEITTALRIQIKPEFQNRRPRGRKEIGRNLFELARFASSGSVEYSRKIGPPRIIDGIVEMDAPQCTLEPQEDGSSQPTLFGSGLFTPPSLSQPLGSARSRNLGSFVQRRPNLPLSSTPKITSPTTKMVEFSDVHLVNTIKISAFPEKQSNSLTVTLGPADNPLIQWRFNYKIRISKDRETWETLFDFTGLDCYFNQTLHFPTQAIKYIDFMLVSCDKRLRFKFISCSLEEAAKPFHFLQGGIVGPQALKPLHYFQAASELPPGHLKGPNVVAMAIVLVTPVSITHLRLKIQGMPEDFVGGDVQVSTSLKWEYSTFKTAGVVLSTSLGNDVCLDFEQRTVSYILVHITNVKRRPLQPGSSSAPSSLYSISAIHCQLLDSISSKS